MAKIYWSTKLFRIHMMICCVGMISISCHPANTVETVVAHPVSLSTAFSVDSPPTFIPTAILSVTPQTTETSQPKVTSIPTQQFTPTNTPPLTKTRQDRCDVPWFFTPAPSGCLLNFRVRTARKQTFERGQIIWLSDVTQSFAFFFGASWKNIGLNLEAASAQFASQLGNATSPIRKFATCGGHTNINGQVTAYIKDVDDRILNWTIISGDLMPTRWGYLSGTRFLGCMAN